MTARSYAVGSVLLSPAGALRDWADASGCGAVTAGLARVYCRMCGEHLAVPLQNRQRRRGGGKQCRSRLRHQINRSWHHGHAAPWIRQDQRSCISKGGRSSLVPVEPSHRGASSSSCPRPAMPGTCLKPSSREPRTQSPLSTRKHRVTQIGGTIRSGEPSHPYEPRRNIRRR